MKKIVCVIALICLLAGCGLSYEEKQQLWTGDKEGNLTLTFIMPQIMADEVHKKLTRNFTHEEWAYYIGNKIPYETFISKAK